MFDWIHTAWQTLAQVAQPSAAGAQAPVPSTAPGATTAQVATPGAAPAAPAPSASSTSDTSSTSTASADAPQAGSAAVPDAVADPNATPLDPGTALPEVDTAADAGQSLMEMSTQSGVLDFVQQSDWVGQGLFGFLLVMSVASWYLILYKWIMNWRTKRRSERFLRTFWDAGSLEQVEHEISAQGAREPFARLASHAIHARNHHTTYGASKLEESGSTSAFVTRTIRKCIDEETSRLENGLTVLASVGSTAPFVGLFGTVWGVYHALIGIGLSDGVTINRIAGPVGEALIMTGLGLAVAIPAVLAYNFFVRGNRVYLGRLDAFAHDLFTFLTTGQQQVNGRNLKGRRAAQTAQTGG